MRQVFTIPGRLAGLNDYVNAAHTPWKRTKLMDAQKAIVLAAIEAEGIQPVRGPAKVSITFYERPEGRQRARDIGNVFGGEKFILDALRDAGILEDDNPDHVPEEHVNGYDCRKTGRFANFGNQRIVVEIESEE